MMKPVILLRDDCASEDNSIEAHILFTESNCKTEIQIKAVGLGADKPEAVKQLIEGLNAVKATINELISFAEAEKAQVEANNEGDIHD